MSKTKNCLAAGALLCSAASGLILPMANTFADSPFSHYMTNTGFVDFRLFNCVLAAYEDVNNVTHEYLANNLSLDDPLPEDGLANITELSCPSAGVEDATGLSKLPNLQVLDLSGNQLTTIDFSGNYELRDVNLDNNSIKSLEMFGNIYLQTLSIVNNSTEDIDISNVSDLKVLNVSGATITGYERARKVENGYVFDLNSQLGFLFATNNGTQDWTIVESDNYSYDPTTKIISIPERDSLAAGFEFEQGESRITISAHPSAISVKANVGNIDIADIDNKYIGETWDSNDYLETINASLANQGITKTILSKVEAFNYYGNVHNDTPNVGVGISDESTDTHVFGTVPRIGQPNIEIVYSYQIQEETPQEETSKEESSNTNDSEESVKVPNTGLFTSGNTGLIVGASAAALSAFGIVAYLTSYAAKRQKSKVRFGRKK